MFDVLYDLVAVVSERKHAGAVAAEHRSVYVAPAPGPSGEKQLYCAKDVPKTVHANVVDSLALRAALSGYCNWHCAGILERD